MSKPEKSPYKGQLLVTFFLILPSVLLTALFYSAIVMYQSKYGFEFNFASAKILGCGCGIAFHMICFLTDLFKKSFQIVKTRLKEFFSFIIVSPKLAFALYWDDIKLNGVTFLIDFAVVVLNAWVFIDALIDFLAMRG